MYRVIGIDPGLRTLGWGVIEAEGARIAHVANGLCRPTGTTLAERLLSLHRLLSAVVAAHAPSHAAVEQTFVNRDGAGTLKLGQARGIALLVPAQAGLDVGEYAPNAVKKAVVGVGHADKAQIGHMIRLHFPGADVAGPDAADALAVALCHLHHVQSSGRLAAAWPAPQAEEGIAMIGRIAGRIVYRGTDHVLIDCAGVGYVVHVSDRTLAALPGAGEAAALFTELTVREDLLQLHGFLTLQEKEWHRLLTSVQGIGAKASLSVLGALGPDGVSRAIAMGDWSAVRAAPGVGPKLAQRLVNELKDKAPAVIAMGLVAAPAAGRAEPPAGNGTVTPPPPAAAPPGPSVQAETLSALVNLGYGQGEAASAMSEAAAADPDASTAALIRAALRLLAPKG